MGGDLNYYISQEMRDALFKKFVEQVNQANAACRAMYTKVAREKIESYFKRAIDEFYADYSPNSYSRTKSLYDIYELSETSSENGAGFEGLFHEERLSGYSRSSSVYDQVFHRGWHGGAGSGDQTRWKGRVISTPHPSPGTPYWRRPKGVYMTWFPEGEPAPISDPSPYDNFTKLCEDYWEGEEGKADYFSCWNAVEGQYIRNINM